MTNATTPAPLPLWQQRFFVPMVVGAQVAHGNPARGMAISTAAGGQGQLYAWERATGALRQLTDAAHGQWEGWLDPLGRHVYHHQDVDGTELGHLVRVPFAGGAPEDTTPDLPPYTLRGMGFSGDGRRLALDAVSEAGFQLVVVPLADDGTLGQARIVFTSAKEAWYALLNHDGSRAAMISTARAGGQRRYSTIVLDTATGETVAELWDGLEASVEAVCFAPRPGDPRLLATTTRSGFTRPLLWNPVTGERTNFDLPELGGEVMALDWSPDGRDLLLCQIDRAAQQLYRLEAATGVLARIAHAPGGYYNPFGGGSFFGPDGTIYALWENSVHPPQLVELAADGSVARVLLSAGDAPSGRAWRSITFASSDGTPVQAWLATPEGDGPFPTIVEMHGGPHFAVTDAFNPIAQAWLDHGFAFCSINFRGSTTFGRAFKEQIWGDVGHWEVEDVVAGRAWLVAQGIADPAKVLLFGASYGGFLTLLLLGRTPDLWAGGMAIAAVADEALGFADTNDALKAAIAGWYGGTPDEVPERYHRSSPLTYAEHVQAPVIIFQGHNDTRTPPRQMEVYVERMRSLGKAIEIEWYDAGHGVGTAEVIAFLEQMFEFAKERV
ncbi:MAG: prolyl oligopeptidase family serine peptidase [Caldilinea sp.]|nr:prolyl oligopeptidase family serine peptidase [Caldilinea sp.]